MTRILLTVGFAAATQAALSACPICFQIAPGPVSSGVRAAVIVLMTVTICVLAGFGVFIRRFVQRSREAA